MFPSKPFAMLLGGAFVFAGLLGFVPNPIVTADGLFAVNAMHNLIHILTGILFLAGAYLGRARDTAIGFGFVYVAVTIVGFLTTGDMLLGLIHINTADRWLHAFLAVLILGGGYVAAHDQTESPWNAASL